MSRFYGSLQGGRGEVTRTGTGSSGISAHPRGWNTGIVVEGQADSDRHDMFRVSISGGSHQLSSGKGWGVLHVTEQPHGERIVTVSLPGRESIAVRYDSAWNEVTPAEVVARGYRA